eukprot:gene16965-18674_t
MQSYPARPKTATATRKGISGIKRPSSAGWKNPNAVATKPTKKFHLGLNHSPLESGVSKGAPFAPRAFVGQSSYDMPKVVNGKKYTMKEYNPLEDPHLSDYYSRKLGLLPSLSDSTRKKMKGPKKKEGATYLVCVTTGNKKGQGTDARVFIQLRGTKGKLPKQQLITATSEDDIRSISDNRSAFKFAPGTTENFTIKGLDIGNLVALEVEHDGLERNQSWFLEEIRITKQKSSKTTVFPCHEWLSLYDSDCQVKRLLKPAVSGTQERIVYEIEVLTGDKRGAGTDAHVFVTIFGDHGQTPTVQLINRSVNTFERSKSDVFKIKTKSLGKLQKLTVEHDNAGFAPGWYLDKIIVRNLSNAKEVYYFPCDKWLSKDDDDGQIMRQLLATRSLDNVKQAHKYKVMTHTGDVRGAGTDANVYVTIFAGWKNPNAVATKPTKKFHLGLNHSPLESGVSKGAPFAPRAFVGQSSYDMPKVVNGKKYTMKEYNPLEDPHLSDYYSRKLGLLPSLSDSTRKKMKGPKKKEGATYLVSVTTGNKKGQGTDARVFIQLRGTKGKLPKQQLITATSEDDIRSISDNRSAFKFAPGTTENFTIKGLDIGNLVALEVEHDGLERNQSWFLEEIRITKQKSSKTTVFPCHEWLSLYDSDCQVKRLLKPAVSGTQERIVYEIEVLTGDKRGAGTDAHVFVTIFGDHGQTPTVQLINRSVNTFERSKSDVFKIKTKSLGKLQKLTVEHDNAGFAPGWYLDKIIVRNLSNAKEVYYFPCDKWLSKDDDDGQIMRQLLATRSLDNVKQAHKYKVMTHTGDVRGAGTDANVYVTIFGDNGDTGQHKLSNKWKNNFKKASVDTFELETLSVGALKRIRIGHDNKGIAAGWFLNKVVIRDGEGNTFEFPCQRWLSKTEDDGKISRDLLLAGSTDSDESKGIPYHIHVTTGDVRGAGTSARVFVILFGGKDGETNSGKLWLEDDNSDNFERGKSDIFTVECLEEYSPMHHIRIGHDNSGIGAGWHLEKIVIESPTTGIVQTFFCRKWLADDEGDKLIERDLFEDMDWRQQREIKEIWNITTYTSDIRGAGTDSKVSIVLYGNEGKTDETLLANETDNFERGNIDKFKCQLKDVGTPIKLRIWHDNSKPFSDWHLDRVSKLDCYVEFNYLLVVVDPWFESRLIQGEINPKLDTSKVRDIQSQRHPKLDTSKVRDIQSQRHPKLDTSKVRDIQSQRHPKSETSRVELENIRTGKKYTFNCGRWLSTSEDDGQIMRELPAEGSGIKPLPVVKYPISVLTGNKRGAGTGANVFINVFGEYGDTGPRPLRKSQHRNKFERNQTDDFQIEAVLLGDLKMIRIGHDAAGLGDAWFLDKVLIANPENVEQKFTFLCDRWLAKNEDDGKTIRELPVGEHGTLLKTTTYKISIRTGDVRGAGTDANAYLKIFGGDGDTGQLALKQSDNTKNKFERARIDLFTIEAMDIGEIEKCIIGHDGKGVGAGWFIDSVSIDIESHGKHLVFPCHRWLASDEDDGKIERELYPVEERALEKKIPYEVEVYTGDVRGAGTNANVFIVLYGEQGKSDEFSLRNKTDNFERAQVDKFKVESSEIGRLTKIRVGHDDSGFGAAWYLEKIIIRRMEEDCSKKKKKNEKKKKKKEESVEEFDENDECNFMFICNRWFAKGEDDGEIVRELVPTDASGRTLRANSLAATPYTVHVFTGDVKGSGTNANVFLTLYGEFGDSGERKLSKSETHMDKFERNQDDVFKLEFVSLGDLLKAKIRHDNSGVQSSWFLDRVEVKDERENRHYTFPCMRWLSTNEDDGQICRELVPVDKVEFERRKSRRMTRSGSKSSLQAAGTIDLEQKASMTTYDVHVTTSDLRGAGTDANVFLVLYGETSDTGKVQLKTSKTFKDKFERNHTDVFSVEAVGIGLLKKIRIGHDNKGGFAGWHLDKVAINAPSLGQKWLFPVSRWLDKGKEDGKTEVEVFPSEEAEETYRPHVPYEITVFTGNVFNAGTDANVFVTIYGMSGVCTKQVDLTESKKKMRKECFNKGSVDTFVRELEDIGEQIEKIRIGHDNKGFTPGWHLEKVEIRRLNEDGAGSTTFTFPCNRWLAKDEDDGAIVRELLPGKVIEETINESGKLEKEEKRMDTLTKAFFDNDSSTILLQFNDDKIDYVVHKYSIHVYTGDVKGAGTDANVFLTMFGENGDTGERQLRKSETHKDKFERKQEDVFFVEAVDLGYIHKITIRHDNAMLNPSWFLDRVEVVDTTEGRRRFVFHCERWLSRGRDDRKIKRHLYEKSFDGDRTSLASSMTSFRGSTFSLSTDSIGTPSPIKSGGNRSPNLSRKGSFSEKNRRSSTADKIFKEEFEKFKKLKKPSSKSMSMGSLLESEYFAIPYTVRVITGPGDNDGTTANASIVFIGTEAVSEKIPLEIFGKKGFTPGSVEIFSVEAPDCGEIKKIEVSHDGYRPQDSWLLKEVEVDVPTTGKKYYFSCECWLGKDKDDGKIARIFSVGEDKTVSYKPKIPHELTVYTGDVQLAGTDSMIYITFFGRNGKSSEMKLEKGEDRFERASVDIIRLEIDDIGSPTKIRIRHDGKGSRANWFLERVMMRNLNTDKVAVFKCNKWLSKTQEDGLITRELAAEIDGCKIIEETTYKIHVHTADVRNSGTDANVFLIVFGDKGDSGELALKNSESHRDKFERGQTDDFTFNMLSLGQLLKIRIWHDNKFPRSGWFLKQVDIEDAQSGKTFEFPCNRWLAKDEDDGSLERELACANLEKEAIATNKQTSFEVTFVTSDKQSAGTNHNAWLMFIDDKGKRSKEIMVENKPKNRIFTRGDSNTVKVLSKPLSTLKSLMVGHRFRKGATLKNTDDERWHLHQVLVKNLDTEDSYTFACKQWIALSQGTEGAVKLDCSSVEKSKLSKSIELAPVKYDIKVYTGDVKKAGTDANVSIVIYGEHGDTGKRQLSKKFRDLFERNQIDDFQLEALDLGTLTKVLIEHDNKGFGAGWFLDKVVVTNTTDSVATVFPCGQWLDKKKGDKQISRELLPAPS